MLASDLEQLKIEALAAIAAADATTLESLRVSLLGKSGTLTGQLKLLGSLEPEARKARGAELNVLKTALTEALESRRAVLDEAALTARLAAPGGGWCDPPDQPDHGGGCSNFRRHGLRGERRTGCGG